MRDPIIKLAGRRPHGQNPGLLLQRYLTPATGPEGDHEERRALLGAAIQSAHSESLRSIYGLAFTRWNSSFPDDPLHPFVDLRTAGRLITGLGSENVLETGIRLHSTYGVPVIPGSGFKGLASHYCDRVWGQQHLGDEAADTNKVFRRKGPDKERQYHRLLFGSTDDKTQDGGAIAFHDAWILPESLSDAGLMLDVMTPHHQLWQTNTAPPTDFDRPVPVAFLSVSGTFRIRVSWAGTAEHPQAAAWTGLALRLLQEALEQWGVGGKTSSGYGRLVPVTSETNDQPSPPAPSPTAKRQPNTPCKVLIVAPRPKGGFDVQESGRKPGTLTLGSPPPGTSTNVGDEVAVVVHNDEPRCPQYRWPDARSSQPKSSTANRPPKDFRR